MAFHFFKAFRVFAETFSFVIARLIPLLYFALFSAVLWLFFILAPGFFGLGYPFPDVFLVLGFLVFLFYWSFFRKRILYVLSSSESVVVSEFIFDRIIPITSQASFGFNLIKKKFSSLEKFRQFEKTTKNAIRTFYGALGFVSFIPNVDSAIFSAVISSVFADPAVDHYTSLRDSLVMFYQKKNSILFQVFAMQILSYVFFFLSYAVLFFVFSPFMQFFPLSLISLFYALLFLLLLIFYSSFVSHYLVCWQSVFFIESIKNDFPSKDTRALLENISPEFNEISSKAKIFLPLGSISSRKLGFFSGKKTRPILSLLDSAIKNKQDFEVERQGKEALTELVSKVTEIKMRPKKEEIKKKRKIETKKLSDKYLKDAEYNEVFNLLLEFLGEELGTKNRFQINSLEKKENEWFAVVEINRELFDFRLDSAGKVINFKEKK
ncbi:MAG: hypothetical protein ABH986_02615 [archaeon]